MGDLDEFYSDLSDSFLAECKTDSEREERIYQILYQGSFTPDGEFKEYSPSDNFVNNTPVLNDPVPVINASVPNDIDLEIVRNDTEFSFNDNLVETVQVSDPFFLLTRFKHHCLSVFIIYNVF